MKYLIVLMLVAASSALISRRCFWRHRWTPKPLPQPDRSTDLNMEWYIYKMAFNKWYRPSEDSYRKEMYFRTRQYVTLHNMRFRRKLVPYKISLNRFSDLSMKEAKTYWTGYLGHLDDNQPRGRMISSHIQPLNSAAIPESIDYRNLLLVPPIKDQGSCGSCWAFAAVACVEFAYARQGKQVILSEQQLIDCSGPQGNKGCEGGLMDRAFRYILQHEGMSINNHYQEYKGQHDICMANATKTVKINGYHKFYNVTEREMITAIVKYGAVTACMDGTTTNMFAYDGGVFVDPYCSNETVNHGVLIVGYGTTDDYLDYWIAKNSWGDSWGEGGYFRISRKDNQCGILNVISYVY